jgi:hypothetical protein
MLLQKKIKALRTEGKMSLKQIQSNLRDEDIDISTYKIKKMLN